DGLVWSRDSDNRWYRPGETQRAKIYWSEAPQAVVLPDAPLSQSGRDDGFRQTWKVGTIEYLFSSGHGYRANHHKPSEPPSKNIMELGSMNEIERAIL